MTASPAEPGSADHTAPLAAAAPDDLSESMAPWSTAAALQARESVPTQLVRFGVLTLRMLRLALKSNK
ncbi:MAG: hypothetical protein L0H25_03550 [Micrococcales bacterium]|nr:hypothetical protein [Micrococcales bacterium]